jgi:hypothetical protein
VKSAPGKPTINGVRREAAELLAKLGLSEDENVVLIGRSIPGHFPYGWEEGRIIDHNGPAVRSLEPALGTDGRVYTCHLLITKVPAIVSVVGTHEIATNALRRVTRDQTALARIEYTVTPDAKSYQILVEVGDVQHTVKRGSIATSVRVLDVCRFERPEWVWRNLRDSS